MRPPLHRPRASVVAAAALFAVVVGVGCAPLTVQQQRPSSLAGLADVAFLGAYDARAMMGGVQTTKQVTTVGAAPVYGAGGYAGTVYYPQTTTVRTGEIAPNDALRLVADGFRASINGASIADLSGTAPLETRSEMGMDWFARNNPSISNHLVSVEVKSASVALDDARSNYTLGMTATVLGVMSPCLACTTLPCLIYPAVASTKARGESTGTLRVYDKRSGRVVHREELRVETAIEAQGFHDPEDVFAALSTETGRRLGIQAADKLALFMKHGASSSLSSTPSPSRDDPSPIPQAPPKPTPPLDRPAGSPPPPPSSNPPPPAAPDEPR